LDDTYQTYLDRTASVTQTDTYLSTLQYVRESPKFTISASGQPSPTPFPGYTIITPTYADDPQNRAAYDLLHQIQGELVAQLPENFLLPLPVSSFHLTIADLIWNGAYSDAALNPTYGATLQQCLARIFTAVQPQVVGPMPVAWKVQGLLAMPRAIGLCLVPVDEASYRRTARVRRAIYQDAEAMRLGIEQQYHFTAHVTLGYFGKLPAELDRVAVADLLRQTNRHFEEQNVVLSLDRAELRYFDDMTAFTREPDWAVLNWVG